VEGRETLLLAPKMRYERPGDAIPEYAVQRVEREGELMLFRTYFPPRRDASSHSVCCST